jgi:hypothetical protein
MHWFILGTHSMGRLTDNRIFPGSCPLVRAATLPLPLVWTSSRSAVLRTKMSLTIEHLVADDHAKSSPIVQTVSKWLDMHATSCDAELAELAVSTGLSGPDLDVWISFTKTLRETVRGFMVCVRRRWESVPEPKFTPVLNFASYVLARRSRVSRVCLAAGYLPTAGFRCGVDVSVAWRDDALVATCR